MRGRKNSRAPGTWSATGLARSAATTTSRPTSALVRGPDTLLNPNNQGRRRYPPPSFCFCRGGPVLAKVFRRNVRALPFAVLLVFATLLPAMAGPFEDAVAKFANDEYSDTEEASDARATSGNPLAYTIVSALRDGRLMADPDTRKVYVTQSDGKNLDALTGAAVDSIPDSAAAVRLK